MKLLIIMDYTWFLGIGSKLSNLWRQYFPKTNGLIFLVDSSDKERKQDEVKKVEELLSESELKDDALFVRANKQDLYTALIIKEIASY